MELGRVQAQGHQAHVASLSGLLYAGTSHKKTVQ